MGDGSRLGALQAQRVYARAAIRYAPAAAAGGVALSHLGIGAAVLIFACTLLSANALEPRRHPMHLTPIAGFAIRALIPITGGLLAYLVSLALSPLDPLGVGVAALAGLFVTAVVAYGARRQSRSLVARVAVIGNAAIAASLTSELELTRTRGYRVVGFISPGKQATGSLGSLDDLAAITRGHRIDLLVQAADARSPAKGIPGVVDRVAAACLGQDVRMIGVNQLFEELFGHVPIATLNSAFFQYLMHPRYHAASPVLKRAVDVVFALIAGAVFAPAVAAAAIAVKLGDRGPVLFRQVRVGQRGRTFEIVKLRTMGLDAESEGARWSGAGDPRVTPVGRVLRRTHLDEVPQLWNVLRGEMTLVGPRPEVPEIVADLEWQIPFYDRRELVKPGITGWAQVRCGYSGTQAGSAWKVCHDLYYLKHRSLALDVMIMLETVASAIRDAGLEQRVPDERFVLDALQS